MMKINNRSDRIKRITATAMFCAMAYVCAVFVKVPVQFLTLDVKDSVIVLCTLLFGPLAGGTVAIIVPVLEFLTVSATGVYGLIMNVLSSMTFAMTAGLIYRYKKSMTGAIIGLIAGVCSVTSVMLLANLFITPYYLGGTVAQVAAMIPKILLPFNLVKAVLNAAIVLLFYKPLSKMLKRMRVLRSEKKMGETLPTKKGNVRTAVISIVAAAIITASLLVIFLVLRK